MYQVYNTQEDFTSRFRELLTNVCPNMKKTQLNILPDIIFGMIKSESSAASNIAKELKGIFSLIQFDSVVKRIRRFFSNQLFNSYSFYHDIIKHVIKNYKTKHGNHNVHLIMDHTYSHENYTVFMISMRVGKQGIPLWFRCFKGIPQEAFQEEIIKEGIREVSSFFDSKFQLIFLADRWFNSTTLMQYIDSLNHKYYFRLKKNMKVLLYDSKEKHQVWKWLGQLSHQKKKAKIYQDIYLTEAKHFCNLVYSKSEGTDDPWILATNTNGAFAAQHYSHRFGGIESLFKNQKSNGFDIESINNAKEKSFTTRYTLICVCILYLTILGTEFVKNTIQYQDVKIETHKKYQNGKRRVVSIFRTGLILFQLAINSLKYIRIPMKFILYDV